MPTLDWIGKKAVLNHHREVPYRLLQADPALSIGDPESGNLLVEGDNLLALKALLPYYAGKVKCIYIDPPYNTGDENWMYNDAVNSPEMRRWLGRVVGRNAEDLCRHDKWLCMMYPRLSLLREFLRDDGVIFVSIDDNEVGNLWSLMDEIYGIENRLGSLVWKRRSPSAMRDAPLSVDHEYILAYGLDHRKSTLYGLTKTAEDYPYEDERGRYASTDLSIGMGKDARPGQFFTIANPRTGARYEANPERVWRFYPDTMTRVIEAGLVIWPDEQPGDMTRPRYKTYYDPHSDKPKPVSSWIESLGKNDRQVLEEEAEYDITILRSGMTQEGGKLLQQLFGTKPFAYPKPLSLVRSLVRATTRRGDLVLDSFAGTATTGHAVLSLNYEDGGSRRFLLVEMDVDICRSITSERLRRVIAGYSYERKGKRTDVDGTGGGFRLCGLGGLLFNETGRISDAVSFHNLAAHVYFSETGTPISGPEASETPLLGVHSGVAIYLLFNGIMGDRRPGGGNVLTSAVLRALPRAPDGVGSRVIYGEGCRLGPARLKREGIIFKQIPYEIKVS
ncbi:MAG: site-specific DNA-methyltransferase [Armatimonadetes bacterium]|nr:site-specific DNA-methyltransferase [Armatimonadota bacterium]